MSTSTTHINQLPVATEIDDGDFLIIDNGVETRRLNFEDFIVGLDNVTFASTISSNSSDIGTLSANTQTNTTNISSISAAIFNQTPVVASLSATTHFIKITINGSSYALFLSATG